MKPLHLNNIGDITILVGPNEGGKSNILLALKWFGTDEPLQPEDKPVIKSIKDDDVIVDLYFKVLDQDRFIASIEEKIAAELKKVANKKIDINLNQLNIDYAFLEIKKRANGSFEVTILNTDIKEQNTKIIQYIFDLFQKKINLVDIFNYFLRENLINTLTANGVPKVHISDGIKAILKDPVFESELRIIKSKLMANSTKKETVIDETLKIARKETLDTTSSFNIGGKKVTFNIRTLILQTLSELKEKINHFNEEWCKKMLQKVILSLKPNFIYLSEEMELKGSIKKTTSWKNTLREENEEYIVNARLFSILGINLDEFDKKKLQMQDLELENKLIEFSDKLEKNWRQLRIRITHNIAPNEITLKIREIDKNGRPIKATSPEHRSRGFRWYLSYVVTLEYIGKKENAILLLDDPAVFLHENGQKDFLRTLENVAKKIQILYTTHLISLFEEKNLDRVLLVDFGEKNVTIVKKPWSGKIENVAAPIYHALGFDKLIFEDTKKVLFVEGISDKFIFEGLQNIDENMAGWYIYPLSGGNKLEGNEIVERIKMLKCLTNQSKIEYVFVLDGDRKPNIKEEIPNIIFLGNTEQEIEDLIDKNFYLDCVWKTYQIIYINQPVKLNSIKKAINNLRTQSVKKLTKQLQKQIPNFSKVNVAITIKRELIKDGHRKKKYFEEVLNIVKQGLKRESKENIAEENK